MKRALLLSLSLLACGGGSSSDGAAEARPTSNPRVRHAASYLVARDARFASVEIPSVPVLLLHQICPLACPAEVTYGMAASEFDALLTRLDMLGYETVSSADFAAFRRGKPAALPSRPIYITFDDGREDAYAGATPALQTHHARATMFVITNRPAGGDAFFMTWPEVEQAYQSGNWDIELHAHAGHTTIPTSPTTTDHFFAWQAWSVDGGSETLSAWRARTQADIEMGEAQLAAHLPAHVTHAFAVPFGDYGQHNSVDPEIKAELREYLDANYEAWFTQPLADPPFARPSPGGETYRYTVRNTTTVATITAWLAEHAAP